jgi:hypothetical protein
MSDKFMRSVSRLTTRTGVVAVACLSLLVAPAAARQGQQQDTQTIENRTGGMERLGGFFPLYWDESAGRLWMEISRWNTEVLHMMGLGAGLGSNDIGLDRGALAGSRIVFFERIGPKVLMVQPNYDFRASSSNEAEVAAVRDAFARSVLWSFNVGAETGDRVLVDLTDFLLRDTNIAGRLSPGTYRLETSRSSVYMPMTKNFPENTEIEVELTFASQPGGGGGRGGAFFEGVGSVPRRARRRACVCTIRSSSCRMSTTCRGRSTRGADTARWRGRTMRRRSASRW